MISAETKSALRPPEPLPPNITSVQPGGGVCYSIELAWGRWRRWYLRCFRRGYIERMAGVRTGTTNGAPHDVYDPRDLKYCANQCTAQWPREHDRFAWRRTLPVVHWGLCELQLFGWPLLAAVIGLGLLPRPWSLAAIAPAVLLALIVYFFRNPRRAVPAGPGLLVAPADGKIVDVTDIEHNEFLGGGAGDPPRL